MKWFVKIIDMIFVLLGRLIMGILMLAYGTIFLMIFGMIFYHIKKLF